MAKLVTLNNALIFFLGILAGIVLPLGWYLYLQADSVSKSCEYKVKRAELTAKRLEGLIEEMNRKMEER